MVDALFIRSLLCSFFFKIFPEIIQDGRLFIAEPPLYRVNDKKNPFVINKEDYLNRYVKQVIKEYQIGYPDKDNEMSEVFKKDELEKFLRVTGSYVDDLQLLSQHYKINDGLLEIILSWIGYHDLYEGAESFEKLVESCYETTKVLMERINEEYPEIYFDEHDKLIKGIIDGRYQSIEISERLIRKAQPLISIINNYSWGARKLKLKNIKTGTEYSLSLVEMLKMLKKFQPDILHRFKGLGENNPEDIKLTTMDPNTRSLIQVHISDIENDMKVFQILRGTSPLDAQARKAMMRGYKIPNDLIDT